MWITLRTDYDLLEGKLAIQFKRQYSWKQLLKKRRVFLKISCQLTGNEAFPLMVANNTKKLIRGIVRKIIV